MLHRIISWSAHNQRIVDLIVIILVVGGILATTLTPKESFPDFQFDVVNIQVLMPRASPQEVEEGIIRPVEQGILGVEGIDAVRATAREGFAAISVELKTDAPPVEEVAEEIKNIVDALNFPAEAERPSTTAVNRTNQVISFAVTGNADPLELRAIAQDLGDHLRDEGGISYVDLPIDRRPEINIELDDVALRELNLAPAEIVSALQNNNLDVSAGTLRTAQEELNLRFFGRQYQAADIEDTVIRTDPYGNSIRLKDVGQVVEAREDVTRDLYFEGQPAVLVQVSKADNEDTLETVDIARFEAKAFAASLPRGIEIAEWSDESVPLQERIDLLLSNGLQGLLLVMLAIWLFLNIKVSVWIAIGIPIAYAGTMIMFNQLDLSINLLSLFGLLTVSGILVDDAIVATENAYVHYRRGRKMPTVSGISEIAPAVLASATTTIISFSILLFAGGSVGIFGGVIALSVIVALAVSLIEVYIVLPAHLKYTIDLWDDKPKGPVRRFLASYREWFNRGFENLAHHHFARLLRALVPWRYHIVIFTFGTLILAGSMIPGEKVRFIFFPSIEADTMAAQVVLKAGTPDETTAATANMIFDRLQDVNAEMTREQAAFDFDDQDLASLKSAFETWQAGWIQRLALLENIGYSKFNRDGSREDQPERVSLLADEIETFRQEMVTRLAKLERREVTAERSIMEPLVDAFQENSAAWAARDLESIVTSLPIGPTAVPDVPGEGADWFSETLDDTVRLARGTGATFLKEATPLIRQSLTLVGGLLTAGDSLSGSEVAEVQAQLLPGEFRDFSLEQVSSRWRSAVGPIPGAVNLTFASAGPPIGGKFIDLAIRGDDFDQMRDASERVKVALEEIPGTRDIEDTFPRGKDEIQFEPNQEANRLGLTPAAIARQLQQAFYEGEALRLQRDQDEVRVLFRLPEQGRESLSDLESFRITLADGTKVPLSSVVTFSQKPGVPEIIREDRSRVIRVQSDLDLEDPSGPTPDKVYSTLREGVLKEIQADYPGISFGFEGQAREQQRAFEGFGYVVAIAAVLIFLVIMLTFRHIGLTVLVIITMPLAFVGTVLGHYALGLNLSVLSMYGLIAVAGVVVNQGIVLLVAYQRNLRDGKAPLDASILASSSRLRPIMLTTITTALGLSPLLFETSLQAQFLIPMAVSIVFGVVVVGILAVFFLPAMLQVSQDVKQGLRWLFYGPENLAENLDVGGDVDIDLAAS